MNNRQEQERTETLLKLALEESLETSPDMVKYQSEADREDSYVFSREYEQKLKKLYKMAERKERRPVGLKKLRNMAAGIVVFLGISIVTVSQVEAFRVPVMQFFADVREKSAFLGAQEETGQKVTEHFKEYEPSYVPAGYTILEVKEEKNRFYIEYGTIQDSKKFTYTFYEDRSDLVVDTEDSSFESIEIDGVSGYLMQEEQVIRLVMNQDNHCYFLFGELPLEEAVKIFENLF